MVRVKGQPEVRFVPNNEGILEHDAAVWVNYRELMPLVSTTTNQSVEAILKAFTVHKEILEPDLSMLGEKEPTTSTTSGWDKVRT